MLVAEGLELAFSPGIKDPVPDTGPGSMCVLLGLVPVGADLANKAVFCGLSLGLSLLSLGLEIGTKLGCIPTVVGSNDMVIPVLLYKIFKVLAVGGRGIWDRVVGKPAFQLSLMPLVVG
jgi:hypothetical protein